MDGQSQFRPSDVEPTTVPIVIVGAGPVGLSLGLTLAHQGIESLILEKNEALDPYSRAILIPTRTPDIFDSWSLTAAAKERGIFNSRLQAYGAESGKVAITIDFTGLEDASPKRRFPLFSPGSHH
jgi:2-polyprenyl-6-methoxyphenol hydroxylase-like FAD-dependent oxidoreductase